MARFRQVPGGKRRKQGKRIKSRKPPRTQRRSWQMKLDGRYFQLIKSRQKTVEGRAASSERDYEQIRVGDIIELTNRVDGERLRVRVERISHYPTVERMLEREGLHNMLPKAQSIQEGVQIYHTLRPDYAERISQGGIWAIKIRVLQ